MLLRAFLCNLIAAVSCFIVQPSIADAAVFGAAMGQSVRIAAKQGEVALTTLNADGDLVLLLGGNSQDTEWTGILLDNTLAAPDPSALGDVWYDPKDGLLYLAAPSTTGLFLYKRDGRGVWTVSNLTELLNEQTGANATPIVGSLTHFVTPDLARDFDGNLLYNDKGKLLYNLAERDRNNVHIAGLDAAGNLVLYSQTRDRDDGPSRWTYSNITQEHLVASGQDIPAWTGTLSGYSTPWNGWNIAGLDRDGKIAAVWTAPDRDGKWAATNLSRSYGTPPLQGGVSAYVNWGINLSGVLPGGNLGVTWWSAELEQDRRQAGREDYWAFTDLTADTAGPKLKADSIAGFTTPKWASSNIAGISLANELVVYGWTPENRQQYGKEWLVTNLSRALPEAAIPVGKLDAVAAEDGTVSLVGVADDGDILRYFRASKDADWEFRNVTDAVAVPELRERLLVSLSNDAPLWNDDTLYLLDPANSDTLERLFDFHAGPNQAPFTTGRIQGLQIGADGAQVYFHSDFAFTYTPASNNLFRLRSDGGSLQQLTPGDESGVWGEKGDSTVSGWVRRGDGTGWAGAPVYLEGMRSVATGADGSFAFHDVPPGVRWLLAYRPALDAFDSLPVTVVAGVNNTGLSLSPDGSWRASFEYPAVYGGRIYYRDNTTGIKWMERDFTASQGVYATTMDLCTGLPQVDAYHVGPVSGRVAVYDYQEGCGMGNSNHNGIYLLDKDGKGKRLLLDMLNTPNWNDALQPQIYWSPDETQIAVKGRYLGFPVVVVLDAQSGAILGDAFAASGSEVLTLHGWSPDGDWLLFSFYNSDAAQATLAKIGVAANGVIGDGSERLTPATVLLRDRPISGAAWGKLLVRP